MACWVVPTIAAELWGVSVNEVLSRIAKGSVKSKQENGFLFVDALPDYPAPQAANGLSPEKRPATLQIVTKEEVAALTAEPDVPHPPVTPLGNRYDDLSMQEARKIASRMRRRPLAA